MAAINTYPEAQWPRESKGGYRYYGRCVAVMLGNEAA